MLQNIPMRKSTEKSIKIGQKSINRARSDVTIMDFSKSFFDQNQFSRMQYYI